MSDNKVQIDQTLYVFGEQTIEVEYLEPCPDAPFDRALLFPRGEPMPQTVEAYKKLSARDLELIMEQKEEISRLKQKVNNLQQRKKVN